MTEASSGTVVLVVTDDPLIREETTYGFPTGVEIAHAGDSREAMLAMHEVTPSAVVVDIQTGSAGGYSLARDMAQSERLRAVPVLMLIERPQDQWLANEAGARRVRVKPVDASELVSEVLDLVETPA